PANLMPSLSPLLLPLAALLLLLASTGPRAAHSAPAAAGAALYQASDHVTPLKFDDLRAVVYSGERRRHWLLQLYHRYCGHCINFAPTFKQFASDVKGWSHTVGLAVIDSADFAQVMTHYGLNGVPSLLFIPSNTSWEQKYFSLLNSEANLMDQLLNQLQPFVPQLVPLQSGEAANSPALLEEASPGRLSRRLILDSLPSLSLRWRLNAGLSGGAVRVSRVPAAGGGGAAALGESASIDELRRLLAPLRPPSAVAPPAAAPSVMAKVARTSDSPSSNGELRPPTLDDLRSGIIRALVSDAAAVSLDKPGVWPAVRDFVRLLNSHLSARSLELGRLLRPLAAWLPEEPPSHDRWLRALADAGFPTRPPDAWVSCRGSKPFLRGYPCSLWQLFHTLTAVRFATAGASGPPVMPVMRRFIIACFSCRYCSENFDKGTAGMEAEIGAQPAPGVELLYLWRKHNTVNKRLSGESSDDPAYPKARFPSAALCSECVELLYLWRRHNAVNKRLSGESSDDPAYPKARFPSAALCSECAEGAASADANAAAFLLRWYGPGAGWASHPEGGSDFVMPAISTVDIMGFFRVDLVIVALCFACALDALLVVWCRLSHSARRLCRRDLSPFRRSPIPVF
ncbi:hypothetical protein BOX15_Mlig004329g2, partial [Macrostomum lignano]